MRDILEKYLSPPREGEGGGAGGGAAGSETAGAASAGAEAGGAAAADAGGSGSAAAAAIAELYRPQGLPETMFGTSNNETIDKLHTALQAYRERDARRGVPDAVEAYANIDADKLIGEMKLDAGVKQHLVALNNDPIMTAVGQFALQRGIPVGDMQGIVGVAYAEAQKAGILDAFVDPATERQSLIPETAKSLPKAEQDKAIDARLQANEDFIKLLSQPGADGKAQLPADVAEHALLMLMDTAKGNQFIEFVRGQLTGGDKAQPLPGQGGQAGGLTADSLRTRRALPENTPGDRKFDQQSYDQLMADYKRLYPDGE